MHLSLFSLTHSRRQTLTVMGLLLIWGVGSNATSQAGEIIYVDQLASGANDGTSWVDAYTDLQDALFEAAAIASDANRVELWIAEGTYRPDRGTGDRNASFDLLEYTTLLGGFAGWEWMASQRDITANETILSGDLLGNDDYGFEPTSDCCSRQDAAGCDDAACYSKVVAAPSSQTCVPPSDWDYNCQRIAWQVCCELCRPTRCDNSYRIVRVISMNGPVVLDGFTIAGGEADGAVDGQIDNLKPRSAAGLISYDSHPLLRRCTFRHNSAPTGAALLLNTGSAEIDQCRFTQNRSYDGIATVIGEGTTSGALITDTVVDFNHGGGIAVSSYTNQTQMLNCDISNNNSKGILVSNSAPAILFSRIIENTGSGVDNHGFPLIGNCEIRNNTAPNGAGIYNHQSSSLVLVNSLVIGNHAIHVPPMKSQGGAILNIVSDANILNCTIVGNSADQDGGIVSNGDFIAIHNSILWGNSDQSGNIQSAQFRNVPFGTYTLLYNSIQGWDDTLTGTGNQGLNPSFVDPIGPDDLPETGDENYRLSWDSPLINAGHPVPPLVPYLDMDGHTRILCGRLDIGAYEFGIADYDCSGTVDLMDFMTLPSCMGGPAGNLVPVLCEAFDFNADNLIDLSDVAGFQNAILAP